jgi:hypothetical protein
MNCPDNQVLIRGAYSALSIFIWALHEFVNWNQEEKTLERLLTCMSFHEIHVRLLLES